jgi:SAM-dependent methyltransferase
VKPQYLAFIRRQAARERLDTISSVLGEGVSLDLPEAGLDLVFARHVFHHLPAPTDYFSSIKKYLKPGGRIAIIDHKPKRGINFVALFQHHTPETTVIQEMERAGHLLMRSFDFLPDQTFTLFQVN